MRSEQTVTLAEIAEYAHVRRPSVSNWRRRHADFPSPAHGTAAAPRFDIEQVAAWLDNRTVPAIATTTSSHATYGDAFREGLKIHAVLTASGPGDDDRAQLLSALAAVAEPSGSPLSEALEGLLTALGPGACAERLLAAGTRHDSHWKAIQTPAAIAALSLGLAEELTGWPHPSRDRRIVDLAAGTGAFIVPFLMDGAPHSLAAAEPDPALREALDLRLRCHGIEQAELADDGLANTPALADADLVLADPPYQPGEDALSAEHPLCWADRATVAMADDGLALVVVPEWTLSRMVSGGVTPPVVRARERLLRGRHVRAVIQLPRRIHPFRAGAELVLLVLTPEGEAGSTVTLCDAGRGPEPSGSGRQPEPNGGWIEEWVRQTVRRVKAARTRPEQGSCEDVPLSRLLDGGPLLPSLRLTSSAGAGDHIDAYALARQEATAAFLDTQGPAQQWLDHLTVAQRPAPVGYQRLSSLLSSGQLRLLPGHRIAAADLGAHGQRVYGREELLGALPLGERRIDPIALARYDAAVITEPGDVVILAEDPLRAVVDELGGSVLVFPVQGLRISAYGELRGPNARPSREAQLPLRPHQLATALRAPRNARRSSGSLVRRVDLRALEIPTLAPGEGAQLDEAMADLAGHTELLRRQLVALERMGAELAAGVADGALTVRLRRPRPPGRTSTPD